METFKNFWRNFRENLNQNNFKVILEKFRRNYQKWRILKKLSKMNLEKRKCNKFRSKYFTFKYLSIYLFNNHQIIVAKKSPNVIITYYDSFTTVLSRIELAPIWRMDILKSYRFSTHTSKSVLHHNCFWRKHSKITQNLKKIIIIKEKKPNCRTIWRWGGG